MTINANNDKKNCFRKKNWGEEKKTTTTPASIWQATEKVIECILQ